MNASIDQRRLLTGGLLASMLVLMVSQGSNDIVTWFAFGRAIEDHGLGELYRTNRLFNHPPLMGYYSWLTMRLSDASGLPFAWLFKLPSLVANGVTAVVLARIWQARGMPELGVRAQLLFIWSPCAVLIAAFHGNTDCLVVMACMLSVHELQVSKRPLAAGLWLAAALNVKVIPILAVLPLLATVRSARGRLGFVAGVGLGLIPFAVAGIAFGPSVVSNIFGYGSNLEAWGFTGLAAPLRALPLGVGTAVSAGLDVYRSSFGRICVIGSSLVLTLYALRRPIAPAAALALSMSAFLIFAPGFGVQYVIYAAAPWLAITLGPARWFDLAAGGFIAWTYAHFTVDWFPWRSWHTGPIPEPITYLGLVAWGLLVYLAVREIRPSRVVEQERLTGDGTTS